MSFKLVAAAALALSMLCIGCGPMDDAELAAAGQTANPRDAHEEIPGAASTPANSADGVKHYDSQDPVPLNPPHSIPAVNPAYIPPTVTYDLRFTHTR